MPLLFVRLLPFVLTGVLFSIFFPAADTTYPVGGPRPPPEVDPAPDILDLLNRFIAAFWNALHSAYATSTTSNREGPRGAQERRTNYPAVLWASAHAQGWAGLDAISQHTLSNIGYMSNFQGGTIVQHQETYVRRFITQVLLEVVCSFDPHAVFSPGLYDMISAEFARSNNLLFPSILDEGTWSFLAATITDAAQLATALVRRIDEDTMVEEAFQDFATNPSSWNRYIQPGSTALSVEDIVRGVHRSQERSFLLPTIPTSGESFFLSLFRAQPSTGDVDLEAAAGPFALYDEDIEYLAALFVAAMLRFHRHVDGTITA